MFGEAVQVVIDLIAYGSNKIYGGQEHLRAREGGYVSYQRGGGV